MMISFQIYYCSFDFKRNFHSALSKMQNPGMKQMKARQNQSFTEAQEGGKKENDEINRVLSTINPNAPDNTMRYNH